MLKSIKDEMQNISNGNLPTVQSTTQNVTEQSSKESGDRKVRVRIWLNNSFKVK